MNNSEKSIVVGLSGGVDSSVTAAILQNSGHNVRAVFMKNWHDEDNHCTLEQDEHDVRQICQKRNIPLDIINLSEDYEEKVFNIMLHELEKGLTPNPDILCNQEIKFATLLHYVKEKGADFLATGHYANLAQYQGKIALSRAVDTNKDQTYFLSRMPKEALPHVLFPLGKIAKKDVRKLAQHYGLPTAKKKDSTGICFIGKRKYQDFISQYLLDKPGEIISDQGQLLGKHRGLFHYTIGQRKGLDIGGLQGSTHQPWFVMQKNFDSNTIIVTQGNTNPKLFHQELIASNLRWHHKPQRHIFNCQACIRHRQEPVPCTVKQEQNNCCTVTFDAPIRAITPGQYIGFYDGNIVLGNGQIVGSAA